MSQIAFTDLIIKTLPLPEKHQRSYWDASLSGFGIRISKGGARTWVVLCPRAKVRTVETIGRYPAVSLQEARGEAKRRLAEATLGKHRPRSVRWDTAVEGYLREVAVKRKPRTHACYKRLLKHFNFGTTLMANLAPVDIHKRLDKLARTPGEQQHAFVALRAFLNWAHARHYVDDNPMARMKPPRVYVPRERILTSEELGRVWRACGDDTFGTIVKLLILTGQRRGEIAALSGGMISGDRITLPRWLTKNNREHVFPLGQVASSLLPKSDGSLFPSKSRPEDRCFSGWGKCKARLDASSGVSDWTLHDLRRTFASGLASLGVSLPVVEKLLNHVSGSFRGVVGVYQRYDFQLEMRAALEKWEAHVKAIGEKSLERAAA